MSKDPRCPWCGGEMELDCELENVWHCPHCDDLFYAEDDDNVEHYEPISQDDYELADFCRGGDLSED